MRFLLAVITLAAAGVGFSYLDQQPAASSLTTEQPALRPFFDWATPVDPAVRRSLDAESAGASLNEQTAATRDAIQSFQAQSRTMLNDFVRDHGLAGATLNDALTPMRDLAQSSLTSTEARVEVNKTEATIAPSVHARDELANAAPSDVSELDSQSPSSSTRSRTPGASVHEATIVRGGKPLAATVDTTTPVNEIAQVADKQEPRQPEAGARATTRTTQAVSTNSGPVPDWKVIGKTTEGRPLHTRRFGDSGPRTLIVAGLDGEDRIAVRWIDQLADELARRPELYAGSEVLIFRAGNPDGLTNKISENARGVLINRNFPSRRYRPLPDMSSGAGPATEAETRALLDTLYTFHPRRVIHLTATSARTKGHYNRAARETASELQRGHDLDVQPLDIEQYPGSLEDFADGTLEAGVLSMQLNAGNDWQRAWSKHQPMIVSAVTGRLVDQLDPTAQPQDELTRSNPAATRTPIPVSNTESSRKRSARGYEELPAPPK